MTTSDFPRPRESRSSLAPPPLGQEQKRQPFFAQVTELIDQLGEVALLSARTFRALGKRPYEIRALFYQMESLGVQSTAIVATTSIFIGMVMTIQFAFGLQRFGGVEYIPRVIVLSFLRELGPTLTAIIVGGRIGSGMAAEVGAMNVTEQVDAVRALGADPHKKLVLPRVAAAILVLPVLSLFSIFLGTLGAMLVCSLEYGINNQYFLRSSLQIVQLSDLFSGLAKTPVFGYIIAIVGCHFGMRTTGGTEGVGRSTTRTVVVVSIAILIADFMLTKIFVAFLPA
ncbi:MAG TPA: ABC transporter permease [Polyangiaceae bacterium]|jgi:phospholipid/cholesterol/gamma-HCH transport system permease protein|nr:ABC transporter permease [Polyangiaceae bacterium]